MYECRHFCFCVWFCFAFCGNEERLRLFPAMLCWLFWWLPRLGRREVFKLCSREHWGTLGSFQGFLNKINNGEQLILYFLYFLLPKAWPTWSPPNVLDCNSQQPQSSPEHSLKIHDLYVEEVTMTQWPEHPGLWIACGPWCAFQLYNSMVLGVWKVPG